MSNSGRPSRRPSTVGRALIAPGFPPHGRCAGGGAAHADPTDVDQILDNLLDNAMAYAPGRSSSPTARPTVARGCPCAITAPVSRPRNAACDGAVLPRSGRAVRGLGARSRHRPRARREVGGHDDDRRCGRRRHPDHRLVPRGGLLTTALCLRDRTVERMKPGTRTAVVGDRRSRAGAGAVVDRLRGRRRADQRAGRIGARGARSTRAGSHSVTDHTPIGRPETRPTETPSASRHARHFELHPRLNPPGRSRWLGRPTDTRRRLTRRGAVPSP